jgi:hypothetical protein
LSTPDSKRLRLSLSAIGAVAVVYLLVSVSLQALARSAETTGRVYPYKQEDWLRYLLPTLWPEGGKPLILLTGTSTTREDILVEEVASAFPDHRVFQGGLSLGTLGDVLAALEYVERAHGTGALPSLLVLGVSPRFLAEIPDERPFAKGLALYSAYYRVPPHTPPGFGLESKPALVGIFDHARFLVEKQGPRYRAAAAWLVGTLATSDLGAWLFGSAPARLVLRAGRAARVLPPRAVQLGIRDYALELASPYRYRAEAPATEQQVLALQHDPSSWWKEVHHWDPASDAGAIRARVAALLEFTSRHGIDLYVVSLPERALSRAQYESGAFERYLSLLHSMFGRVPFLDLRCFLDDSEFYDADHALLHGARRVTAQVIGFVNHARSGRASPGDSRLGSAARTAADQACDPASEPGMGAQ